MRAAALLPLVLAAACASPAPRSPETPDERGPAVESTARSPAGEAPSAAAEPAAPSRASEATADPLPVHLLLPQAASVAVIDVAALRALGLGAAVRLWLRDALPGELGACGERLFDQARRIVVSRELMTTSWAMAIEQPIAPERVLECLAGELPGTHAQPVAGRAGLVLALAIIAMDVEGTLVIGSERGLATLLGEPPPPPPPPDAVPEGAELRGDVTIGDPGAEPRDVRELLPELELGPDVIVSTVQSLGLGAKGDMRFLIRHHGPGLRVTGKLTGFGAQLGVLSSVSPHGRSILHEMVDQIRTKVVDELPEPDAAAVTALLDPLRIDERGDDLHLVLDVPDVALAARALLALERRQTIHDRK